MKASILAAIGIILLIAFSCSNEGGGFFARLLKGGGGSAVPVRVESVVVEERSADIKIPASLEASESAEVALPEEIAIERVLVAEGDRVNAGDPVIKISEQEIASRLARLRTDLKEAKNNFDKNSYFLKNRDRLLEEGRIDHSQYDNLEAEVGANEASVEKLGQEIARLEERSGNTSITSPISGVVGRIIGTAGVTMPAGRPMMSIVKSDPIIVSFRLPSQSAAAVRSGQMLKVRFLDLGGEPATARIASVGTELDKDGTFGIRAFVPNPQGRYKVGMKAEVELTGTDRQRFFIVPEEALIKERHAYFVFTVVKGVAHKVQVIPNETLGNRVEIARGLAEDDLVVVKGNDKLTEGTVVDIWRN